MLALVAKKKLRASARALGWPAARAPFSYSVRIALMMANTCGFPASIVFAISLCFGCVPVERKLTAASLLAGIVVRVFSSRRRATRSTMILVIAPPAASLKLPPRPLALCAIAGAHEASITKIRYPLRLTRKVLIYIVDPFRYTDSNDLNRPLKRDVFLVAYAGK